MENHINKSVIKANKKLYMIYKLRKCLLWFLNWQKHIDKFDNVQKRALRIISYGRGANKTYEDTVREYDVQKLHNQRKEHLLMNMFAHKINPEYVDMNRPDMLLRNHDGTKFKIRVTRNQKLYKSPYYRGVKLWEQLPNATRTLHGVQK